MVPSRQRSIFPLSSILLSNPFAPWKCWREEDKEKKMTVDLRFAQWLFLGNIFWEVPLSEAKSLCLARRRGRLTDDTKERIRGTGLGATGVSSFPSQTYARRPILSRDRTRFLSLSKTSDSQKMNRVTKGKESAISSSLWSTWFFRKEKSVIEKPLFDQREPWANVSLEKKDDIACGGPKGKEGLLLAGAHFLIFMLAPAGKPSFPPFGRYLFFGRKK